MSKNFKLRERTREHVPRYCAIFLTDYLKYIIFLHKHYNKTHWDVCKWICKDVHFWGFSLWLRFPVWGFFDSVKKLNKRVRFFKARKDSFSQTFRWLICISICEMEAHQYVWSQISMFFATFCPYFRNCISNI